MKHEDAERAVEMKPITNWDTRHRQMAAQLAAG